MNAKLIQAASVTEMTCDADGIYSVVLPKLSSQIEEQELRTTVAQKEYKNYLAEISKHHSIPVMDKEIVRFLRRMPQNALILDIGGCWGWHWRLLAKHRPDVSVIILDFVHANLLHAKKVLGSLIGTQVLLVHADATDLSFWSKQENFLGFDGVWTVQVLQHIPDFALVCEQANNVLRDNGWFVNYSFHKTPLNRLIYFFARKPFHMKGVVKGAYYLEKANKQQEKIVSSTFLGKVKKRYSECLFHPELKVNFSGRDESYMGRLDARLSSFSWIGRWIARQQSFEVCKNSRHHTKQGCCE